jgi:2-haloacid dehalogenase
MNQFAPVDAVVFDIGKVLIRWEPALAYVDIIPDPAERARFLADVVTFEWHSEHDAGRSTAELVAERSALFPEHAEKIARWFSHFNLTVPGPVEGMAEIVQILAGSGVPLYAITNFGAETWAGFRPTFPLAARFRDIVVSGVEKLAKPDPAIYALSAAGFGHVPARMLFIEDSLPTVIAARDCGWQAHHFTDAPTLRAELIARALLD